MFEAEQQSYQQNGWCRFAYDSVLADWISNSLPAIQASISAPENSDWLRYGGTWFAGVNALPNDTAGAVSGGPALSGNAIDFIRNHLPFPALPWDRAQVSVCYPGYPQRMAGESDAVHAFRKDRDAAHVDGLRRQEPGRRRFLDEHHGFILGIPVTRHSENASPLTVWEGSHNLVRSWLQDRLQGIVSDDWDKIDLTDGYHDVRRMVFETCTRIPLFARPGEAYLVHRHALHGMAPWGKNATAGQDGRIIVYFRPGVGDHNLWLTAD